MSFKGIREYTVFINTLQYIYLKILSSQHLKIPCWSKLKLLGIQTIHIFELVNDFTKDDLSKMETPLEAGVKLKHCKCITPKMTTLKNISFLPQKVINVSGEFHEETG